MYWPSTSKRHLTEAARACDAKTPARRANASRKSAFRILMSRPSQVLGPGRNRTKVLRPRPSSSAAPSHVDPHLLAAIYPVKSATNHLRIADLYGLPSAKAGR